MVAFEVLARTKSNCFTVPSGVTFDVGWLQIPVHDPLLVRRLEARGDLPGVIKGRIERHGMFE